MTEFATLGIVLGLSAGISPGPLLTLVIAQTMRHGIQSGVRVALSPLITDLPIVLLTLFLLTRLSNHESILGIISLIGGIVIFSMGISSFNAQEVSLELSEDAPRSLRKGILVNVLSPHPYLFWLSVGAPIMSRALNDGIPYLLSFLCCFYACLVGAKITLAQLVGRSRRFLQGRLYHITMRLLGSVLCFLAILLWYDGLKLLGLLTY